MATSEWLDAFQTELAKQPVSALQRARLVRELRDHIDDLCCEERTLAMSTESLDLSRLSARLGHPQEVARAVGKEAAKRPFSQRHPAVTFLLLPIPMLLLLWIGYGLALVGLVSGFESYRSEQWAQQVASVLVHGIAYFPPAALTLWIGWIAVRNQTRKTWWILAAALVALVSATLAVGLTMPTTPGTGQLSLGCGFPPPLAHWPQACIPLALTGIVMIIDGMRRGRAQTLAT
jgi:hypothetical protein